VNPASTTVVPQRSDNHTNQTTSYDVTRTIRMSREELRKQRLHEMADIFMDAFEAAR
jgi:hypothetical protein